MKIGFLISYFHPFTGGAENNCYFLARELQKRGHEIHVFTSDRKDGNIIERKEETIEGIRIHRAKTWLRYRYYVAFYPTMLAKIIKQDLDILHVHSFGFLWHDIIVLLKKIRSKTKILNTPHGPFMTLSSYNAKEKIIKKIIAMIEKPINRIYDLIIQVNPKQKEWMVMQGIKEKKIRYLPNGISKEFLERPTEKEKREFLKKYKLEKKFIVSYLGRIQKYKGNDQVIKVLAKIIPKKENIIFLIMGSNVEQEKERLLNLAKEKEIDKQVHFIENINDIEKKIALSVSEIFILPSEWEAFGIVLLEAMTQGNAIISTRTEGGLFLIEEGKNGYLFDYNNENELKEKMLMLIKEERKRKQMQKENRKKASQFTWNEITKELEKIYEEVMK